MDLLEISDAFPAPKSFQGKRTGPKPDRVTRTIDALSAGQSFVMENYVDKALTSRLMSASARNFARYTYRSIPETDSARVWRTQ